MTFTSKILDAAYKDLSKSIDIIVTAYRSNGKYPTTFILNYRKSFDISRSWTIVHFLSH